MHIYGEDEFLAKVIGKVGDMSILYVVRGGQVNYVVCKDFEKSGEYMPSSEKSRWFRSFEEATNFVYKRRYGILYRISFIPSADAVGSIPWHTVVKGKRDMERFLYARAEEFGLGDNACVVGETDVGGSISCIVPNGKILVKRFKLGDLIR